MSEEVTFLEGTLKQKKGEPRPARLGGLTKAERHGRQNVRGSYSIHDVAKELEPYSLYPRQELIKLLKMAFWLMATNIIKDKLVILPFIGRVWKHKPLKLTVYNARKQLVEKMQVDTVRMKPSSFMRFLIDAPNVARYHYAKCHNYLRHMEHLRIHFHQHGDDWLDQFIPEKRVLDYIKYKVSQSRDCTIWRNSKPSITRYEFGL